MEPHLYLAAHKVKVNEINFIPVQRQQQQHRESVTKASLLCSRECLRATPREYQWMDSYLSSISSLAEANQ